jgi:type III secretion protein V
VFAHNAFPAALAASEHSLQLTVADYVSNVRASLKRYISHKYTRGQNTLIVYLLDPQIEARLRDPTELRLEERTEFIRCVRTEVGSLPPTAQEPVLLTSFECRLRLRNELRHEFPRLMVVSYQELSPDMNIQPIARISSDDWPESP